MCRYQCKDTRTIKNQIKMTMLKETNKILITNTRIMEFYGLSDKEFRIIILKNPIYELREHGQLN